MAVSVRSQGPHAAQAGADSREYRWIYAATLPVFVVAAVIGRLTHLHAARAHGQPSVMSEARATAHTIIPFAFMH